MRFLPLLVALLPAAASAQILVNSTAEAVANDGQCTLREAIVAANTDTASGAAAGECAAGSGADTVRLIVPAGSVLMLTSALPVITQTLTLEGPTGRADGVVLDGAGAHRVLELDGTPPQTLTLRGLTVRNGRANAGAGVLINYRLHCVFEDVAVLDNVSTNGAGGVSTGEEGSCSFDRVLVRGNVAQGPSGGGGVRISSGTSATIRNSTFADNAAPQSSGGGILVGGFSPPMLTFVLEQSTLSGNTAGGQGGGLVQIGSHATNVLRASTISGNSSGDAGGGASLSHVTTFQSTVVAGNTSARDAVWADLSLGVNNTTSLGGNLIGTNGFFTSEFPTGAPNAGGDFVGTAAAPLAPMLAALADNGGPTPTRLPMAGSPLLDAGRCAGLATDQRGAPREHDEPGAPNQGGDACDTGAAEGTAPFVAAAQAPETGLALGLPFPSPARTGAAVLVTLDAPQRVRLAVVDVLGREVAVLVERDAPAGTLRVNIPAARLAPGVYTLRLDGAAGTVARRLTVAR